MALDIDELLRKDEEDFWKRRPQVPHAQYLEALAKGLDLKASEYPPLHPDRPPPLPKGTKVPVRNEFQLNAATFHRMTGGNWFSNPARRTQD